MSELRDLYQEVILDHNKNPRNFGELEGATHRQDGHNPLCGDRVTVMLLLDEEKRIKDVRFSGEGCAISKASASVMTDAVKGKSPEEVEELFNTFHDLVMGHGSTGELGKLAVFAGVSEFPMRVKCATLAWHTLQGALRGDAGQISTE